MRTSARCREPIKNGVVDPQHQNAASILNDFHKNVNFLHQIGAMTQITLSGDFELCLADYRDF
jgi:hypothetical protein